MVIISDKKTERDKKLIKISFKIFVAVFIFLVIVTGINVLFPTPVEKYSKYSVNQLEQEAIEVPYYKLYTEPDSYKGTLIHCRGKVIQSMGTELRIVTEPVIEKTPLGENRSTNGGIAYIKRYILSKTAYEGDYISFYGVSNGLYTYNNIDGDQVTVPSIIYIK